MIYFILLTCALTASAVGFANFNQRISNYLGHNYPSYQQPSNPYQPISYPTQSQINNTPVCGSLNGTLTTLPSIYEFNKLITPGSGWTLHSYGPCPSLPQKSCNITNAPVCATLNNEFKTFPSELALEVEKFVTNTNWIKVSSLTCTAAINTTSDPNIFGPICGVLNGTWTTFTNIVEFNKIVPQGSGWNFYSFGPCPHPSSPSNSTEGNIFGPVCGVLNGVSITLSNLVEFNKIAKLGSGWSFKSFGSCSLSNSTSSTTSTPDIFGPVCGNLKGQWQSFSNIVEFNKVVKQNSEWKLYGYGTCPSSNSNGLLPNIFESVCGILEGTWKTFSNIIEFNKVLLTGSGWNFYCYGPCPITITNTTTPSIFGPVCGILNGTATTFSNLVEFNKVVVPGFAWSFYGYGSCPLISTNSSVPNIFGQVCGILNGTWTTFPNIVEFNTVVKTGSGLKFYAYGICPTTTTNTTTPSIFGPVCGFLNGAYKTFSNLIEFNKVVLPGSAWNFYGYGECPSHDSNTNVPNIFGPVCGTLNGTWTTFSNIVEFNKFLSSGWHLYGYGSCPSSTSNSTDLSIFGKVCGLLNGTYTNFANLIEFNNIVKTVSGWSFHSFGLCPSNNSNSSTPDIFGPVCASLNGTNTTFSNLVEFNKVVMPGSGWIFLTYGPCPQSSTSPISGPVCGKLNGAFTTFSNINEFYEAIKLNLAWSLYGLGPCPQTPIYSPAPNGYTYANIFSPNNYGPVCGVLNQAWITFPNIYEFKKVEGAGWTLHSYGPCPLSQNPVPTIGHSYANHLSYNSFGIICGILNGTWFTFPNMQEFLKVVPLGWIFYDYGPCPKPQLPSPNQFEPLCALYNVTNELKTFPNILALELDKFISGKNWIQISSGICPTTTTISTSSSVTSPSTSLTTTVESSSTESTTISTEFTSTVSTPIVSTSTESTTTESTTSPSTTSSSTPSATYYSPNPATMIITATPAPYNKRNQGANNYYGPYVEGHLFYYPNFYYQSYPISALQYS